MVKTFQNEFGVIFGRIFLLFFEIVPEIRSQQKFEILMDGVKQWQNELSRRQVEAARF